jgi:hypothetical protein
VLEVDTVVQMELLMRPVEHRNGYSFEGVAPFLGYVQVQTSVEAPL